MCSQVHGEVNILHDLVLAFVECGRLRQARRILETPGLQTRHRRLDDACQRYVEVYNDTSYLCLLYDLSFPQGYVSWLMISSFSVLNRDLE